MWHTQEGYRRASRSSSSTSCRPTRTKACLVKGPYAASRAWAHGTLMMPVTRRAQGCLGLGHRQKPLRKGLLGQLVGDGLLLCWQGVARQLWCGWPLRVRRQRPWLGYLSWDGFCWQGVSRHLKAARSRRLCPSSLALMKAPGPACRGRESGGGSVAW